MKNDTNTDKYALALSGDAPKHTPGPWTAYETARYFYVKGSGEGHTYVLQRKKYLGKGENVRGPADCSLITAAPDLLTAAKCAANVLFLLQDEVTALGHRAGNVQQMLADAITKAEN